MKKMVIALIFVLISSTWAWAQMGPSMMGPGGPQEAAPYHPCEGNYGMHPGWGMMGPGMMGPGYGMMGPGWGMMGPGYGMMGPGWGMMGPGYGMMGPGWGMMGPGYGMMGSGWGMMGPGGGYDYENARKFMDETRELRRNLMLKNFEYYEAMRDPGTKPETLKKLEEEIGKLYKELNQKSPSR